jgi:hypothetical protein
MKIEVEGGEPVLRPHGPWREWHPNGRMKVEGEYLDGRPAGVWRTYHENGTLASEVRYEDGLQQGEEVGWHPNGTIRARGAWKDGRKEGTFTHWNEDGAVVREEEWTGGALSAPIRLRDPKGEFPPEADALAKASVGGKYRSLLHKVAAPDDRGTYGDFSDYGPWSGDAYMGLAGLVRGYWVYVYPYWYVWAEQAGR